jgi:hypothetical protein
MSVTVEVVQADTTVDATTSPITVTSPTSPVTVTVADAPITIQSDETPPLVGYGNAVQQDGTYTTAITTITPLSQAQYDALGTPDAATLYVIV